MRNWPPVAPRQPHRAPPARFEFSQAAFSQVIAPSTLLKMHETNYRSSTRETMINAGSINRLIHESSPYLLQHAHNPVDWYAWGPEAFNAAQEQNKPIFLSVGYSTCYWCHVMERQSFENES